jgi:hypothetical protein
VVTYVLQLAMVTMHLGRLDVSSGWISVAAAFQSILLIFRLQFFSRALFPPTRFAFVDDIKAVISDVKWYLVFILLVVFGWAVAFHILFRADQAEHEVRRCFFRFFEMTCL